jgi:hypothetical protein
LDNGRPISTNQQFTITRSMPSLISIKVTGSFCSSLHWRNFIDEKLQEGNDCEVGLWSNYPNDSYFIYYSLYVHFFGLAHAQEHINDEN